MRDFASISPRFWLGETGKSLRGNPELQVLAMYLMTSPHANMIGVYDLPIMYLCRETGLSEEGALKGLESLSERGFCKYDEQSEMVFVTEFARYQIGAQMAPNDNKVKSVQKQIDAIPSDVLKAAFYARYASAYHLKTENLEGASEGAFKPPISVPVLVSEVKSKKTKVKTETFLPENFSISDSVRQWAKENGHGQLEAHLSHFIDIAKAKGYKYADWDAAFRNAIKGNWAKLSTTLADPVATKIIQQGFTNPERLSDGRWRSGSYFFRPDGSREVQL